jgi:hypothetical protein
VSTRKGLAIAAAIAGVVLASGISAATLLGWIQPSQSAASPGAPAESGALAASSAAGPVEAAPQIVLVPVTPAGPAVADPLAMTGLPEATGPRLGHGRSLERERGEVRRYREVGRETDSTGRGHERED